MILVSNAFFYSFIEGRSLSRSGFRLFSFSQNLANSQSEESVETYFPY